MEMTTIAVVDMHDWLQENLPKCTEEQQMIFKRMYSPDNLDLHISEVIELMPPERLPHAKFQVENTLRKNAEENRHGT